jgi:hypothetical protein
MFNPDPNPSFSHPVSRFVSIPHPGFESSKLKEKCYQDIYPGSPSALFYIPDSGVQALDPGSATLVYETICLIAGTSMKLP